MRISRRTVLATIVVLLALLPTLSHAVESLSVDFGNGYVQSAYEVFLPAPGPEVIRFFRTEIGQSGIVAVRVQSDPPSPVFEWRVRGMLTGGAYVELSALLHDFVFSWFDGSLVLRLEGLTEGDYQFSSFHHDTEFGDHGAIDISVLDIHGLRSVASRLEQTWGFQPDTVAGCSFVFSANGTEAVIVRYSVTPGTGNAAILNGFIVSRVPATDIEAMSWGKVKALFRLP